MSGARCSAAAARSLAELLDAMMGRPASVALQLMIDAHQLDDSVEQLAAETDEIFAGLLDVRLATMPGLIELLSELEHAKIPKAIATSSGPDLPITSWASLRGGRIQFILTCNDVPHGKPHPEIYLRAAGLFGLRPNELLVLEDSQNGCRAAVAAGTVAVAVPSGHSLTHDFAGAALIASSLADPHIRDLLGLPHRRIKIATC